MVKIPLTQNKFTLVDDSDFEWLNQWKWHYSTTGYAVRRSSRRLGKQTNIFMARLVMKAPKGLEVDHINRNTLDNRRKNLRICTHSENQQNKGLLKNNKSGYTNISWRSRSQNWRAQIRINGKRKELGCFNDPLTAYLYYLSVKKGEIFL